jgi:hypothetical protein
MLLGGQAAVVKLVDPAELQREREAKAQQEEAKKAEKERKKAEQAALQAQKDAQRKISPQDMFKTETDKYSQFDDKVSYHCNIIFLCVCLLHSVASSSHLSIAREFYIPVLNF